MLVPGLVVLGAAGLVWWPGLVLELLAKQERAQVLMLARALAPAKQSILAPIESLLKHQYLLVVDLP